VGSVYRRYLHSDHQGSIIAHSDTGGGYAKLTYDPYGIPGVANIDRFGYTGQTWLKEIGLDYYKARVYSPGLGRFLQTDPIYYKGDFNLYAYAGNDPVDNADPTGMVCTGAKANEQGATQFENCPIDVNRQKFIEDYGEDGLNEVEAWMTEGVNTAYRKGASSDTVSVLEVGSKADDPKYLTAFFGADESATSLSSRVITYDPSDDRVMSTNSLGTETTLGGRIYEAMSFNFNTALRHPFFSLSRLVNGNGHETFLTAWGHEGIHIPSVHNQLGPDEAWKPNHDAPFNNSGCWLTTCKRR
jgi:RHS repeat-associated protein